MTGKLKPLRIAGLKDRERELWCDGFCAGAALMTPSYPTDKWRAWIHSVLSAPEGKSE